MAWFRRALALVVLVSCAPQAADRGLDILKSDDAGAARDADGAGDGEQPEGGGDVGAAEPDLLGDDRAVSEAGLEGGAADGGAADRTDALAAADQVVSRVAILVVGDRGTPTVGDTRIALALGTRDLEVRLVSDTDAADVTGASLVVLSASSLSADLGTKYRDVAVPVLVLEQFVFDAMGMTGSTASDHNETGNTQVTVVAPGHAMAAGLTGNVAVVSPLSSLGWGRPAAGAERVATLPSAPDQVALFGYHAGAMMSLMSAPARRVGCFLTEAAALSLNDNGVRLLGAAIDWALQ